MASKDDATPLASSVSPSTVAPCSGVVTLTRPETVMGSAAVKGASVLIPKSTGSLPVRWTCTGTRSCWTPWSV